MIVSAVATCAIASPEDDQVASYLKSRNMLSLLEIQLEERIEDSADDDERSKLAEELSDLYLNQLRSFDQDDPYRPIVVNRAQSLVTRMGSIPMYELRIELLIEAYIAVEPNVELARLELLDLDKRSSAIADLSAMDRKLKAITSKLDPKVAKVERLVERSSTGNELSLRDTLPDLRRYRSLAHYYYAWTGYSLAVLKDQHVPSNVFVSFGWLLGGEGEMPQFSVFNETTLEFEHVARSAIGVALAHAQSDDVLTGRAWAEFVAESEHAEPDAKEAAEDRLLQIMAMDRDWTDAYRLMLTIGRQRGEDAPLRIAEARYLALRSLEAMQSSRVGRGGVLEAEKVARYAVEVLVEQGEIGHVLDLYQRFDSLPLVADSFITNYALAIGELNRAEQSGGSGMYATVASYFSSALESPDADRFPSERDDCSLKLAYTEIRSGRPAEALKACDQLIKTSDNAEIIEEARWLRIAAIDSINTNAGQATSDAIEDAVREYIVAYPSTERAAKLILRYAMQGTVDSKVAISTLESIQDEDQIAIPARRTLVQLRYQRLRAMRFSDQPAIVDVLTIIRWIDEQEPNEIVDISDAKSRLGTVRIGLDLSLRISPPDLDFARHLVERGLETISFDPSFKMYRAEFVYRMIEIAINRQELGDAMDLLDELGSLDPAKADNARVLLFNHAIRDWKSLQTTRTARLVVDLGSDVLARQTPPYPQALGGQVSTVAEAIAESAVYLWLSTDDSETRDLALRVSLLVLERGQPSEPGLRRTAMLSNKSGDTSNELEAWLRLLAAYPASDDRWFEARYESLRIMKQVDFTRALSAYDQFRVLHPSLGPAPWDAKIATLFGDPVPEPTVPASGDAP